MKMNMEHWWNGTDWGKTETLGEKCDPVSIVYQKA